MSEAIDLTKSQPQSLRDTADKAITMILRSGGTPAYNYFGDSPHLRYGAGRGRPTVSMWFIRTKNRRCLRLKAVEIDTYTERRRWNGASLEKHEFFHTLLEPLDLSEACMAALNDLERQAKEASAAEDETLDNAALAKLVAALVEVIGA